MIYPRAEKWVQIDWAKVMLLESVIVYKKQNIDHFWPLYLLNLNFKMLYYKTFFSEFMEFQRIIWFILICLHFVMTQKVYTEKQLTILSGLPLWLCAVHSDVNCLIFVLLDLTFHIFQQNFCHQISTTMFINLIYFM